MLSTLAKATHKAVARRALATTTAASSSSPKNPLIPSQYQYTFKKAWLSDSATYPILVIMAGAASLATGMSVYASLNYKNVKVRSEHKGAIIPTWDKAYEPNTNNRLTEAVSRYPISFLSHGDRLKSLRHEGLGVDHEQWQKEYDARKKANAE